MKTANTVRDHQANAETALSESDYGLAGHHFSLAAYGARAQCDYPNPATIIPHELGQSMCYFQCSALAFELHSNETRAENQVNIAKLVLKDASESLLVGNALQGFAEETRADLNILIGNIEEAESAFDAALRYYKKESDPAYAWFAEPLFEWEIAFFRAICSETDIEFSQRETTQLLGNYKARIMMKRKHFEEALASIRDSGSYSTRLQSPS
ncbi:hypothetical protein [Halorubellus litoreus]|uniref:Tetratricopeptide repeat-containing protein n=1 Tax=Halorubellus litoreus TaxID=755308 RepID=A0ABD5VJQ7_9EURY